MNDVSIICGIKGKLEGYDLGGYVEERDRIRLKDYLEGAGEKWVTLELEWGWTVPGTSRTLRRTG